MQPAGRPCGGAPLRPPDGAPRRGRAHPTRTTRTSWATSTWCSPHSCAGTDWAGFYLAPFDDVLSPHDIVQPDILFIVAARLAILTEANAQGAPDLVIEILSPSTRRLDETLKRKRYDQLGVQEYWLFDPKRQSVQIFRRSQGAGFGAPSELTAVAGQILTTPLLPGLEIALSKIFVSDH
jgi:Uma2 family endonuclease